MPTLVRVRDGRVEEWKDGVPLRSYGDGIAAAATDGSSIVVTVASSGLAMEWRLGGQMVRNLGDTTSGHIGCQVVGDVIILQRADGRCEEWVNGNCHRMY